MKKQYVSVGEHLLLVVVKSDSLLGLLQKHYAIHSSNPERQPDLLIEIEEGYGCQFTNYDVHVSKEDDKIHFRRADYSIEVDPDYTHAKVSVYDELAFKHALMNLYSSFIVHRKWGLLIHSSCVVHNGKAHLFAGYSGAGKSTAARLSHPRAILSDEASLIKITPTEITVFNSPFRSEVEVSSAGTYHSLPMESIQLLIQALFNQRTKLAKSNALLQVMDKVFYWTGGGHDETVNVLLLLKTLIDTVPVYELHFQKNPAFWELIS